jgi:hypothetical protein
MQFSEELKPVDKTTLVEVCKEMCMIQETVNQVLAVRFGSHFFAVFRG